MAGSAGEAIGAAVTRALDTVRPPRVVTSGRATFDTSSTEMTVRFGDFRQSRACRRTAHLEWIELHDGTGATVGLYCSGCGATIKPPVADPGEQIVPI